MCDGTWIQLPDGGTFDLLNPRVEDVRIGNVAHQLAQINRFTGAAKRPYNVGQHSCLVARLLPPRLRLPGLLHDSHESVTNDWSSPLKRAVRQLAPGLIEQLIAPIERVFEKAFGIDWLTPEDHAAIKQADLIALATEKRDLMPLDSRPGWAESAGVVELPPPAEDYTIHFPWSFEDSKFYFEEHFKLYTKRR